MRVSKRNKRKIFNDPVYGFVTIPDERIFDLVEHKYFQRLRRIKQLGLTHLVYPGALHTRFQHSLGAMYLMTKALNELRFKGHDISEEELISTAIAILLHDIGHGPYSHALENSIVDEVTHEDISGIFMKNLDAEFAGTVSNAIDIYNGKHPKKYLTKLIAGQFDMDRLDYLKRDSFFTGVAEGTVNYEWLLSMINIHDGRLVIEEKGIYSVEKFLTARRLMYWQVYLHKTVLVAEYTIMKVLKRARELSMNGVRLFATPSLEFFLNRTTTLEDFENEPEVLKHFAQLDDYDISAAMKVWCGHEDYILSFLSKSIVNRRLLKIKLESEKFDANLIEEVRNAAKKKYGISDKEVDYLVINDKTTNYIYKQSSGKIDILKKTGEVVDITSVAEQLNISVLNKPSTKYFLCYPKGLI